MFGKPDDQVEGFPGRRGHKPRQHAQERHKSDDPGQVSRRDPEHHHRESLVDQEGQGFEHREPREKPDHHQGRPDKKIQEEQVLVPDRSRKEPFSLRTRVEDPPDRNGDQRLEDQDELGDHPQGPHHERQGGQEEGQEGPEPQKREGEDQKKRREIRGGDLDRLGEIESGFGSGLGDPRVPHAGSHRQGPDGGDDGGLHRVDHRVSEALGFQDRIPVFGERGRKGVDQARHRRGEKRQELVHEARPVCDVPGGAARAALPGALPPVRAAACSSPLV